MKCQLTLSTPRYFILRARNHSEAESRWEAGFRNFIDGYNTMILHFAIRNYLCKNNQRYHITDLSKGALLVRHADADRIERYKNWYPLLIEEIELVASANAIFFYPVSRHRAFYNGFVTERRASGGHMGRADHDLLLMQLGEGRNICGQFGKL